MDTLTYFTYQSPIGKITLASNGQALTHAFFGKCTLEGVNQASSLTNKAACELLEYFSGKRRVFTLPLQPAGSSFQKEVWSEIQTIPYGKKITYSELATLHGSPQSLQVISQAVHKNPLCIFIPSHRIVKAQKSRKQTPEQQLQNYLLNLELSHA